MGALRRGARAAALATVAIAVAAGAPILSADAKKPDGGRAAGKSANKHVGNGAKKHVARGRGHGLTRKASRGSDSGPSPSRVFKKQQHFERDADSSAPSRPRADSPGRGRGQGRGRGKSDGRAPQEAPETSPPVAAPPPAEENRPAARRERRNRATPGRVSVPAAGRPPPATRRAELERPASDAARVPADTLRSSDDRPAPARAPARARRDASERRERAPVYRVLAPEAVERIVEVVPARMRWVVAGLAAIVVVLLFGALLVAARGRRTERHRARLVEEVGLLQRTLLPDVPERIGGLRASVAYRPADGPGAGGDFYDVFRLGDGRVGIVLGDVSGHGREVLGRTASLRYTLRAYLEAGLTPRAALRVAGEVLDRDFDAGFATVVLAVHDGAAGALTYAAAGHPPPLVSGPAAHEPVTAAAAPPVGAGLATGQRQTVIAFGRGARACFFTDGLAEARGPEGMLGRDGVARLLADLGDDAAAERVLASVRRAAPDGGDDMAVCLVRAERGAPPAGAERVEELALARAELATATLQRFLWACGVPGDDAGELILEAQRVADLAETVVVRVRLDGAGGAPAVEVGAEAPSSLPAAAVRRF